MSNKIFTASRIRILTYYNASDSKRISTENVKYIYLLRQNFSLAIGISFYVTLFESSKVVIL